MSQLNDINDFLNQDLEDMPDENDFDLENDDDLFDEDGDLDDDGDESVDDDLFEKPKINKAQHSEIAVFLDGLNEMFASTLSGFTGMDPKRYKPQKEQTKSIAKAFVNTFPEMELSPKFMFFALVLIVYGPITGKFAHDIKTLKKIDNETGSNVHSFRHKQNRQNNADKKNNEKPEPPNSNNNT